MSNFLGSIERTFLFIRQTQPLLKRFCIRNISECSEKIIVRNHSHQTLRPKRRRVLKMMRMKPQDHPFQQAEPAEYSKYCRSSRYTLWKARRVRFCHTFPRELGEHVLVLRKYNNVGRLKQFFNIKKP